MPNDRKPYPSDVSDEEWAFSAPPTPGVSPRGRPPTHPRPAREVFDALRWIVRAGASWRMMPHDFPPWEAVCTSRRGGGSLPAYSRRWSTISGRSCGWPPAARPTRRRRSSTAAPPCALFARKRPPRGLRRRQAQERLEGARGRVDALGHLLALHLTPADEQDRAQVEELAEAVQEATGESVELAST